jgi:hypothetical protein
MCVGAHVREGGVGANGPPRQAEATRLLDEWTRLTADPRMMTAASQAAGVVLSAFVRDVALFL